MTIELNTCQKKAKEEIFSFLLSDKQMYYLSGGAGYGKTTLLADIHNNFKELYLNKTKEYNIDNPIKEIHYTATTNKAATVLSENGLIASTVHSYLGLKVYNDYKTGETKLSINKSKWSIKYNTLLIIDEASMIDVKLKEYILMALCKNTSKVIFVGDKNQLKAVKGGDFTVFDICKGSSLNTLMRVQNNDNLKWLNSLFKQGVELGQKAPKEFLLNHADQVLTNTNITDAIKECFIDPSHNNVFLAYTNKVVVDFNKYVRKLRNLPDATQIGEQLISNQVLFTRQNTMIATEELVKIDSIGSKTTYCGLTVFNVETDKGTVYLPKSLEELRALSKQYKKEKDWYNYYSLVENVADFRPKDAQTVHKSQGSTYNNVFLDINDLYSCKQPDTLIRLLYVAVSRAKHKLIVYNSTN